MSNEATFTKILRCINYADIEELKDLHRELCSESLTMPIAFDIRSTGHIGYPMFRDMIRDIIIKSERKRVLVSTKDELSSKDCQDYKNIGSTFDEDEEDFSKWNIKPYWLPEIWIPYYEYTFSRSYSHKVRVLMKRASLKNELYPDDVNYITRGDYTNVYYSRKANQELFLECAFA